MDAQYPGEGATFTDLMRLAEEYRVAAQTLLPHGRKGAPLSRAPCRLTALQAIELYLSAYLLASGLDRKSLRGLQHDVGARYRLAAAHGLVLRKRTADHLGHLTASREYVVARYCPEMTASLSQINRLIATLDELATKVKQCIGDRPKSARA
ncbi:hypothetical protein KEU06_05520 [Pseudaminobacter sp. 19-2017]|uniref:HEPN domain-containing protein n=1 Tax=Pseudaminobacter soli (ex Zhang et al. 2022) TaxID=2831468 RepID=A0A942E400_9HYPH|nr:hypothetical protein [Pseudaminobacter soli]